MPSSSFIFIWIFVTLQKPFLNAVVFHGNGIPVEILLLSMAVWILITCLTNLGKGTVLFIFKNSFYISLLTYEIIHLLRMKAQFCSFLQNILIFRHLFLHRITFLFVTPFLFFWDLYLFLIVFPKPSVKTGRQWTHLIFALAIPVFWVSKLLWKLYSLCHWPFVPPMLEKCPNIFLNIFCNLLFNLPLFLFYCIFSFILQAPNSLIYS